MKRVMAAALMALAVSGCWPQNEKALKGSLKKQNTKQGEPMLMRYKHVYHPLTAKQSFLVDRVTGRTWQIVNLWQGEVGGGGKKGKKETPELVWSQIRFYDPTTGRMSKIPPSPDTLSGASPWVGKK
jgi:hypothetical protein